MHDRRIDLPRHPFDKSEIRREEQRRYYRRRSDRLRHGRCLVNRKLARECAIAACQDCSLKSQCTTGPERRIPRWEHEHLLEAVQQRLDANPQAMRQRRETVEHPFGTMKARMGATHFLTKTLPNVAAEMALSVLVYNLTRVMNIIGTKRLITAIAA
ncbi:transposase [Bradyrhizobium sp. 159]|nr:transposase [Bradyrhizobium sp. 159]